MYDDNQLIHADSMKKIIYNLPIEGGGGILSKLTELENKIKTLESKLESAPKDLAPPIGTYMYSKNNPASIYTGTIWQKIEGGTYLTAADDTNYTVGVVYGTNSLQLVADNIPVHNHTMSHTHAGPSHTHSTPAHTHDYYTPAWLDVEIKQSDWAKKHEIISPKSANSAGTKVYRRATGNRSGTGANQGAGTTGAAGTGNTGDTSHSHTGRTGKSVAFNNMPKSIAIPL